MNEMNFIYYYAILKWLVIFHFREGQVDSNNQKLDKEELHDLINRLTQKSNSNKTLYTDIRTLGRFFQWNKPGDLKNFTISGPIKHHFAKYVGYDSFLNFCEINQDRVKHYLNDTKVEYRAINDWSYNEAKKIYSEQQKTIPKGVSNPEDVERKAETLNKLYNSDDIETALMFAVKYDNEYPREFLILKELFRCQMTKLEFSEIRKKIMALRSNGNVEALENFFKLRLAECELREGITMKDFRDAFLAKLISAQDLLVDVEKSRQYYYLNGRCNLELWWLTRDKIYLGKAIENFDEIPKDKIEPWDKTYHLIALNAKYDPNVSELAKKNLEKIRKENSGRISTVIHEATMLILLNEKVEFDLYAWKEEKLAFLDLKSALFHHIDLIFPYEHQKDDKEFYVAKINSLSKGQNSKSWDEDEINHTDKELQLLYDQDEIKVGVIQAKIALKKYGAHYNILKHYFRFNMRVKDWFSIRSTIETLKNKYQTSELITLCKLALFECEIREANSVTQDQKNLKILNSVHYLNEVPEIQQDYEEFLYWKSKWFLELWSSSGGTDISNLKQAKLFIDAALKKKYKFYYHLHQCIVLKLLEVNSFNEELRKLTEIASTKFDELPKKQSIKHCKISTYLLNDDMPRLNIFLTKIDEPTSVTDFQFSIFKHLNLIFFYNQAKKDEYHKVLSAWMANLPEK